MSLQEILRNVSRYYPKNLCDSRNRQVNHARNVWDRAITILPRANQFWYKYTYMEEMLGNVAGRDSLLPLVYCLVYHYCKGIVYFYATLLVFITCRSNTPYCYIVFRSCKHIAILHNDLCYISR